MRIHPFFPRAKFTESAIIERVQLWNIKALITSRWT